MSRSHQESSTSYLKMRVAEGRTQFHSAQGHSINTLERQRISAAEFITLPVHEFTLPPVGYYLAGQRWRKNLNFGTNQDEEYWVLCEYRKSSSGKSLWVNVTVPVLT